MTLNELGWRCVHDSHYAPTLNEDAVPLFKLYPKLYQRHGPGTWCTSPGLAALAAFRKLVDDDRSPRDAAAAIGMCFSEPALISLCDTNDATRASEIIHRRVKEEHDTTTTTTTTSQHKEP